MKNLALAQPVLSLSAMLLLAVIMLMVLKRRQFPYTIGLVVAGLITGFFFDIFQMTEVRQQITLSHDMILYILLPPLVYEASLEMDIRLLKKNLAPILILATVGLLVSIAVAGGLVAWLTPVTLIPALIFGALISATDPVAVIALFRELHAPARLNLLMDGESLFNDATAIVMFEVLLGLMVKPEFTSFTALEAVWNFLLCFVGGALVGAVFGFIMSALASMQMEDKFVQITLSIVTAWGSFILADHYLGLSGVMACVTSGLVSGYFARTRLEKKVARFSELWWSFAAFLANSYIFLLLGLKEERLLRNELELKYPLMWLFVAIFAVLIGRLCVIYGLIPLYNCCRNSIHQINSKDQLIMFWGGLRGAVPMALVLSLPPDFPERGLIFNMTLAVILWTLLVQGTTMKPLLRKMLQESEQKTVKST